MATGDLGLSLNKRGHPGGDLAQLILTQLHLGLQVLVSLKIPLYQLKNIQLHIWLTQRLVSKVSTGLAFRLPPEIAADLRRFPAATEMRDLYRLPTLPRPSRTT